jgi:hypothetical protein
MSAYSASAPVTASTTAANAKKAIEKFSTRKPCGVPEVGLSV